MRHTLSAETSEGSAQRSVASIDVDNETVSDLWSRPAVSAPFGGSGWCDGCGRRRGRDGRCPNCDPWWGNAFIQIGGPMILGTLLLLFLGIRMLSPRNPAVMPVTQQRPPASPVGVSPHTAWAASRSVAALASGPISAGTGAAPGAAQHFVISASVGPSPEAMQRAQLEYLRSLSRQVDAALESDATGQAGKASSGPALLAPEHRAVMAPSRMSAESGIY